MDQVILAYHEISAEPADYLYSSTAAGFAEHLRVIVAERSAGARTRPVEITFDDGHISQYQFAFPLLNQYSCRATFFVTASWIGRRENRMNWLHLKELAAQGHGVKSHGWSHMFLTRLPPDALRDELIRSKRHIEDNLGAQVEAISLPGGRWNRRVLDACGAAGYTRVYISVPWTRVNHASVQVLGRVMVRRTNTDMAKLLMLTCGTSAARLRTCATSLMRFMLGDGYYHRLWCTLADRRQVRQK